MKTAVKKYTEEDLKRAFEAGHDHDADYTLAAYWKFFDYSHYKRFLKVGKKVGRLYHNHG